MRSLKDLSKYLLALASLGLTGTTSAKDLSGHLGLGVSRIGMSIPSLSGDWQLSEASSFEFNVGLDTYSGNNNLILGVDYARNLFLEENQSFFLFLGGGLTSQQTNGVNTSGYFLQGGIGARFFFSGLPNLGFSVRGGGNLTSAGNVRFRTIIYGGMHYYF